MCPAEAIGGARATGQPGRPPAGVGEDRQGMTRRTDIAAGLFVAAFAALLLVWVIPANTSPPQSESNLSPAFLPTVAAVTMLLLSLLLTATTLLKERLESDTLHEEFGAEATGIGWREMRDIAIWGAFSAAMMVGFSTIGFVATAVPALVLMLLYAGQRNLVAIATTSIATPGLIYLVAWHAFGVQLP